MNLQKNGARTVVIATILVTAVACGADDSDVAPTATASASDGDSHGDSGDEQVVVTAIQEELMAAGPGRERVEFAIDAPDAEEVTLEIDANYWGDEPRQTIRLFPVDDERGSHAVTLHLGSDLWRYRFRVDGVWTVDPSNPLRVAVEDGREQSMLVVGEALPWLAEQPDVATGAVHEHTIPAGVLGEDRTVVVYTPPGYDDEESYPLLVLLHGAQQPASSWIDVAAVDHAMDNLLAADEITPFVIAMPNLGEFDDVVRDHILDEVVPFMNANYSVDLGPDSAAVGGQSMGGHATLELAYHRPELFGLAMPIMMWAPWCGGSCSDVGDFEDRYPDGFDLDIAMWVGANDELGLVANHEVFAAYLDARGLPYEHRIDTSDGHFQDGHTMRYVRTVLPDVLRRASRHFGDRSR